jgi:4'-phosphopantetheinyl transferase EntD
MNEHKSDVTEDIKIEEVKEQELINVFPLFLQLNPSAKEVVFKRNYANVKKLGYELYKAVADKNNRRTF